MAMTTADARLTYDYRLRDVALECIQRLERVGYEVRLRYSGENRQIEFRLLPEWVIELTLSRYTDVALMERVYGSLIESLSRFLAYTPTRGEGE